MSVVNVIDMTFVFDRGVAAVRGVPVTVVGMDWEIAHKFWIQLIVVWLIPLKDATSFDQLHCAQCARTYKLTVKLILTPDWKKRTTELSSSLPTAG